MTDYAIVGLRYIFCCFIALTERNVDLWQFEFVTDDNTSVDPMIDIYFHEPALARGNKMLQDTFQYNWVIEIDSYGFDDLLVRAMLL